MTTLRESKRPPAQRLVKPRSLNTDADTYEMANLYPRDTGLPMTVWVSPRGRNRHDARIKVCRTRGDKMDGTNLAVVAIRPVPRVVHGPLAQSDFAPVAAWIALNEEALLGYWNGTLSTLEFGARLRRLRDTSRSWHAATRRVVRASTRQFARPACGGGDRLAERLRQRTRRHQYF